MLTAHPSAQRLRDSALRLFAEKGFEATGIRELADAAGMTSANVYYHAGSKEELLMCLMRECLEDLIAQAAAVTARPASPAGHLRGLVTAHVRTHIEHRLLCLVSDNELRSLHGDRRASIVALRDTYQEIWEATIRRGMAAGEFAVADTGIATLALLEMCTGVVHWFSPAGRLSVGELGEQFAVMALRCLGAPGDAQEPEKEKKR